MADINTPFAKRADAESSVKTGRLHRVLDPASRDPRGKELCALAVMTKAPRAGQVKTRLIPPLTPDEAAQLNICFLRDTALSIADAANPNARGIAVYTPIGAESVYAGILPREFDLLPQRGDGFGERLAFAAEDLFQCGFASVCLIDSDSPTVLSDVYKKAVEWLSKPADCVVLGPSDDGGYYLIGLKRNVPELFDRIDWSTEHVLEQTTQRAQELNLKVLLLPTGYDIDDRTMLRRLRDELLSDKSPPALAPHTRKFVAELAARMKL